MKTIIGKDKEYWQELLNLVVNMSKSARAWLLDNSTDILKHYDVDQEEIELYKHILKNGNAEKLLTDISFQ